MFCSQPYVWQFFPDCDCCFFLASLAKNLYSLPILYLVFSSMIIWKHTDRLYFVQQDSDLFATGSEPFAILLNYATHQKVTSGHHSVRFSPSWFSFVPLLLFLFPILFLYIILPSFSVCWLPLFRFQFLSLLSALMFNRYIIFLFWMYRHSCLQFISITLQFLTPYSFLVFSSLNVKLSLYFCPV